MTKQEYMEKFDAFIAEGFVPTWEERNAQMNETSALLALVEDLEESVRDMKRVDAATGTDGMSALIGDVLKKALSEARYQLEQAQRDETNMNDNLESINMRRAYYGA